MRRELKNFNIKFADEDYVFRTVLFEDYKSLPAKLPINGGWGYSMEKPIQISLIDLNNSPYSYNSIPAFEHFIINYRLWEELIVFRTREDQYKNIQWKLSSQSLLITNNGNKMDQLIINGTCYKDAEFKAFMNTEYLKLNESERVEKLESIKLHFTSQYFFEICEESFGREG